jgi:hypothetical protein
MFRKKLNIRETSVLNCRVDLTDADVIMELNNARYLVYMELGRWDYSSRVGFLDLMKKHKWGIAVGGASIRFRRRDAAVAVKRLSHWTILIACIVKSVVNRVDIIAT